MSDGMYVEIVEGQVKNTFAAAQPGNPDVVFWASDSPEYLLYVGKKTKHAAVLAEYQRRIAAGYAFTHNGVTKVARLTTERMQVVLGAFALVVGTVLTDAGLMQASGLPPLTWPKQDFTFETQDKTFVNLSRAETVTLASGILMLMVQLNGRRNQLLAAIAAADQAALDRIDPTTGWPA